jgi:glycosyltransferase involved in cell wall biosynthesis
MTGSTAETILTAPVSFPRVAFVYPNSRRELVADVERGEAPDSTLLGQNHLAGLGIEAHIHEPRLTRTPHSGLAHRLTWNLRELTLPWELREADVAFTPLANLLPLAARARPGLRVVVVNYGLCMIYERSSRARRRLLAESLRSASAVVCLGKYQREQLLAQIGLDPARVRTALLGIDERFFAPRPMPESEPYVLTVGKDLSRDFATFVEAVRDLGVRAELAVYPRNLERIELPPNARARVVGPAKLRDLYAGAACVVIPQRRPEYSYGSEGGGLTSLLESMAMARPTVISDRPILHDYVRDGETAVIVPPEDPAALASAIGRVLADPGSLGAAGRKRVEAQLTTRHLAERLAPIFREAAR